MEKAPIDIAHKITTATNTQNKVEPKDFLALDSIQDGLAEAFKKIGVQYCFKRGEKVIDPSVGLDVQELSLVLAISSDSMTNVTIAKRNFGSLTDPNGHYKKLYEKSFDVPAIWEKVKKWRVATEQVARLGGELSGRDSQIAIHGNRFIEHMLLLGEKPITDKKVQKIYGLLREAINENYMDCYLAVLFKNAKKCESLKSALLAK